VADKSIAACLAIEYLLEYHEGLSEISDSEMRDLYFLAILIPLFFKELEID